MLCPYCGAVLADPNVRCARCQRTPPPDPHARHAAILAAWSQGALAPPAYQQAIAELVVMDASGRAWLPAPQADQWFYWAGQEWRPYGGAAPVATSPTRPRRRVHWLAWVVGIAALVVAVMGGALALQGRRAEPASAAATATLAPPVTVPASTPAAAPSALVPTVMQSLMLVFTATPMPAPPTATPTPRPTSISQVSLVTWKGGLPTPPAPFAVTGGQVALREERYCLTPVGATLALATQSVGAGDLSAQVLALAPQVEGATVGLAGCGLLFEVDSAGQWRQTPLGADGQPGAAGPWQTAEGLASGGQYTLGLLCEGRTAYLVAEGLILAEQPRIEGAPALAGLAAALPAGASADAAACFDNWRVEVWPGATTEHPADDRQLILAELGMPDAFSLEFEQEPTGGLYRVEAWSYADAGMTFTFADGVLIETQGIDTESAEIVVWPVGYDPLAFTPEMTPDDVRALLGVTAFESLVVPVEFGEEMLLYAGDQIVLGFTEGELEFVETLPITAETES